MEVDRPDRRKWPLRRTRRRATDRLEDAVAWLLTALALITVLGATAVGEAGYADVTARVRAETGERASVRATLLDPATQEGPQQVRARWVGPDGVTRSGVVPVRDQRPVGVEVRVWLDRAGRVVEAPLQEPVAVAVGWIRGALVALAGWALLALLWVGTRRLVDARNAAAWARGWARVEPAWSGRA